MDIQELKAVVTRALAGDASAVNELAEHIDGLTRDLIGSRFAAKKHFETVKTQARIIANNPAKHDWAAPVAPEGWKFVPVCPTDSMAAAAIKTRLKLGNACLNGTDIWDAMLAAAPQAVAALDRNAVLEEAAQCCQEVYRSNPNGLNLIGQGFAEKIRSLKQAPQPIAAPATKACSECHGKGSWIAENDQDDSCNACGGVGRVAASQQPVPALSASIDTPEFWALMRVVMHEGSEEANDKLVEFIDECAERLCADAVHHFQESDCLRDEAHAAQLVQQRATLSDEQIDSAWESVKGFTIIKRQHDLYWDVEFRRRFARAILAAGGAK